MCNNNKNNEIALIVMKNMIMAVDIYDEFSFNQKCFLNALSNCACESVTAEKLICSFLEIIAKQCSANYNEEEDISALEKAVIDKNVSDNFGKAVRYKENTDIQRDSVTHLWDAYQTSIDRGQNEIMKLFTVVTSVFLPMTVIVGWYGMNFKYMPEISFRYGYVYVILLNIAVVLTLIYIFKKKKWI